ncbi:MAG: VWA domain-containing protein [Paludibacteraceae bacterium]|nr:VWA domain-containing protein [Paludibacteraceae bacterium]
MFRFANPEYLYLLILIPILVLAFIYYRYRRASYLNRFGNRALLESLMPSVSLARPIAKISLFLVALAAVIVALAEPQIGAKKESVKRKGVEVMVALDISNSMMAEDVVPNRLERSKQILLKMIDNMNNDKLGVVVFAGDAFVQLPMTGDYKSAKLFISSISTSMISRQGTAIGKAIDMSSRSFSDRENVGRSIIVITDGENHEDDAVSSAKNAVEQGIQVNVVGIGKPEGSLIPLSPGSNDYKKDRSGNPVVSKLNEQMGQNIAEAGNGIYVRADNSNAALNELNSNLEKLSSGDIEAEVYSAFNEQFQICLWIALIFLLLEFCLLEKKNRLFSNIKLFE